MCDDPGTLSRRSFLRGSAAALAGTAVLVPPGLRQPIPRRLPLRSPARPVAATGGNAYSMAMHVHSSFSEQSGSMDAQLYQAALNSVDVLMWTDHADRMEGLGYRTVVHFTSLTAEQPPGGEGKPWQWVAKTSGSPASKSGGIVTSPVSPGDPGGGSLQVQCQGRPALTAGYGFYANSETSVQPPYNYRSALAGQQIQIDVNPDAGWSNGYLEVKVTTSYHEAAGGNQAGTYCLSYRIAPGAALPPSANGREGIVWVSAPAGQFATVTLSPAGDIASLFPAVDFRDCGLFQLELNAVSTGDSVSGYFGYLRFARALTGTAAMSQQQQVMAALQPGYPSVVQQQGLEVSWQSPHLNWFGSAIPFPDLLNPQGGEYGPAGWLNYLWQSLVPSVHSNGGLASYNHPYGTKDLVAYPPAIQDSMLASTASAMLGGSGVPPALGCDILEAGYPLRAGVDLAHHMALWDVMSRNAVFLTGTGVNDDHTGTNWYGDVNNWTTSAWAASAGQPDLLAAIAAGRCWCGSLAAFPLAAGSFLDLLVDGSVPMGKVSVSALTSRTLQVLAAGLPAGGSVAVLRGAVDYAGQNGLGSNAVVIGSFPAASFATGSVTLPVDTSADAYYRVAVLDQNGVTVAVSNPVWLLQNPPPNGIPAARQA